MNLSRSIWLLIVIVQFVAASARAVDAPKVEVWKDPVATEFFRRTNGWVAGDGATSVPLSNGNVLWLFGDSHIDCYDPATATVPCLFQARNAAILHDPNDPSKTRTLVGNGKPSKSFFQSPTSNKHWFWPVCGFQERNTVFVYLTELDQVRPGNWGFKAVGHYWGKLKFPEMTISGYSKLADFNQIDFGCGFVRDGDYTYAFGNKLGRLQSDVYVARFRTAHPERNWRFWDGTSWSGSVKKAAVIGHGASSSLNVVRWDGNFILTASSLSVRCDMGKEIFVAVANNPTGPFSPLTKAFTVDDTVDGHYPFFYLPEAHPEYAKDNALLITYCVNGYEPCLTNCVNGRMNPDWYRPRAIRVRFVK